MCIWLKPHILGGKVGAKSSNSREGLAKFNLKQATGANIIFNFDTFHIHKYPIPIFAICILRLILWSVHNQTARYRAQTLFKNKNKMIIKKVIYCIRLFWFVYLNNLSTINVSRLNLDI